MRLPNDQSPYGDALRRQKEEARAKQERRGEVEVTRPDGITVKDESLPAPKKLSLWKKIGSGILGICTSDPTVLERERYRQARDA